MVFVAKTVVYKNTVMIEFLDASVAEVTVFCVFWSEIFTMYTYVVEMITLSYKSLEDFLEIWLFIYVAWIH